jgi:Zinc finger, C3HC4 type (RING finger)
MDDELRALDLSYIKDDLDDAKDAVFKAKENVDNLMKYAPHPVVNKTQIYKNIFGHSYQSFRNAHPNTYLDHENYWILESSIAGYQEDNDNWINADPARVSIMVELDRAIKKRDRLSRKFRKSVQEEAKRKKTRVGTVLAEDRVAENGENECVGCLSNVACMKNSTCGHAVLCIQCHKKWKATRNNTCPICRVEFETMVFCVPS